MFVFKGELPFISVFHTTCIKSVKQSEILFSHIFDKSSFARFNT